MELLRNRAFAWLALSLSLSGCGPSVVKTIPLETDTFITTDVQDNRAELPYIQVSKSGAFEDRIITKLPSSDKDPEELFGDVFEKGFGFLFLMPLYVLAAIAACEEEMFQPANITDAVLKFDNVENLEGGSLVGKLTLSTLARPWWQSATWVKAHSFSKEGQWGSPGGDIDPSFVPESHTETTSGSVTTQNFKIHTYYKALAQANGTGTHYGLLIQATNPSLGRVRFASTQSTSTLSRPRVEVTYTGTCKSLSSGNWLGSGHKTTYIMGREPIVITEPIVSSP